MTKPPQLPSRSRAARRSARPAAGAFGELAETGRLRMIALDAIAPNPKQPRRRFDPDALQALADSIADRGILQPPTVRPTTPGHYELVAGERRCRAARIAGLVEVEALIGDHDDATMLVDALMENVAREGLSPIEKARSYALLVEDLGMTREAIGKRVGASRVSVSNHLRLLDLPDAALELVDNGALSFAHGRALLLTDDHAARLRLAGAAVAGAWTTRKLEDEARRAGAPRARQPARSADADAFAQRTGDALSRATGLDLRARVTSSGTFTLTLADQDAVRTLAARLGVPEGGLDEAPAPTATARRRVG
jgi:ParB family chromosome partitioning protein